MAPPPQAPPLGTSSPARPFLFFLPGPYRPFPPRGQGRIFLSLSRNQSFLTCRLPDLGLWDALENNPLAGPSPKAVMQGSLLTASSAEVGVGVGGGNTPWNELTPWRGSQPGRGTCPAEALAPGTSLIPQTPCNPEGAIKPSSQGACKEQELMAGMGSIVCYESHSVPYHSQMPGRGMGRQPLSARWQEAWSGGGGP